MNGIILISAVCMQIGWISGVPHPNGVGAYAYQDSTGNRYGGTYGLNGERANLGSQEHPGLPGNFPVPFGPDFDDFFPEYFRNFENLLQDRRAPQSIFVPQPPCYLRPLAPLQPLTPFKPLPPLQPLTPFKPLPPLPPLQNICSPYPISNDIPPLPHSFAGRPINKPSDFFLSPMKFRPLFPPQFPPLFNHNTRAFVSNKEYQRKALETAKKAFDITSNQAGFIQNIDFSRFSPFGPHQFPNFEMPTFENQNSAIASGIAAPGFTHQYAGLNPSNPNMPNVHVSSRFSENVPSNGIMSVSTSSFSSSTNVNGKPETHRTAETFVNNNGKVTHYKVHD